MDIRFTLDTPEQARGAEAMRAEFIAWRERQAARQDDIARGVAPTRRDAVRAEGIAGFMRASANFWRDVKVEAAEETAR